MKRAISMLVSLLVFSTAQARPLTESELIWHFMMRLSPANSSDKGEFALSLLKDSDLSDAAALRLRNYSIDAMQQSSDLAKQSHRELCALKGGSRAVIADQLTKMDAEQRGLEKNLVENMGLVLSDEEQRALNKLVSDTLSSAEVFGDSALPDLISEIRAGTVDTEQYMEQICGAPSSREAKSSVTFRCGDENPCEAKDTAEMERLMHTPPEARAYPAR